MKKRIQKYLAGEREGFSLVELIIVIAIMAILIGVIALAVIPNIQKSRESKDLTTLDNVLSAVNTAVASAKIKGNGTVTITKPYGKDNFTPTGFSTDEADKLTNAFFDAMAGSISLGSGPVADQDITITISDGGKIEVGCKTKAGDSYNIKADGIGKGYVECERTDSDSSSGKQAYYVSN